MWVLKVEGRLEKGMKYLAIVSLGKAATRWDREGLASPQGL